MSNIPKARENLRLAQMCDDMGPKAGSFVAKALSLMTREPYDRRVPSKHKPITLAQIIEVRRLRRTTDLTGTEIANRVKVNNAGRISEICKKKRIGAKVIK